jgi:chaperonin GroES
MVEKLEALLGKVIIERESAREQVGRIIVPEASRERPWSGIVHSVGPGYHDMKTQKFVSPPELKPGDRVLVNRYCGYNVTIDGRQHLVCEFKEVICAIPHNVDISCMDVKQVEHGVA